MPNQMLQKDKNFADAILEATRLKQELLLKDLAQKLFNLEDEARRKIIENNILGHVMASALGDHYAIIDENIRHNTRGYLIELRGTWDEKDGLDGYQIHLILEASTGAYLAQYSKFVDEEDITCEQIADLLFEVDFVKVCGLSQELADLMLVHKEQVRNAFINHRWE